MRPRWLRGAFAVGLVLVLYVGVWRPLRAWSVVHLWAPGLAAAAAPGWQVHAVASPPSVGLQHGSEHLVYNAPAGRSFLLPALLLLGLVPSMRVGIRFIGVALALGGLGWASALLAVRGVPGAGAVLGFLDAYVTLPLLVGVALWWTRLLAGPREASAVPDGSPTPAP